MRVIDPIIAEGRSLVKEKERQPQKIKGGDRDRRAKKKA